MVNTFIFNEGYEHRGVWHLADKVIEKKVPARDYEYESEVIDYHARKCPLSTGTRPYYDYTARKYIDPVCNCGHTGESTGEKNISRSHWPETIEYKVPTVACNQVKDVRCGSGWKESQKHQFNKPGIHEYTYTNDPKKFLFEAEDFPPGPVCSRCRKKLEEKNEQNA